MKKNDTTRLTHAQFETIYWARRASPDCKNAYQAYLHAEAEMERIHPGQRMYKNYDSFKNNLSKREKRRRRNANTNGNHQPPTDKKEILTGVLTVVNTYLSSIDLPFLQKYHAEIAQKALQMETFGPMNGTYDPHQLQHLKTTATALQSLITYIQSIAK